MSRFSRWKNDLLSMVPAAVTTEVRPGIAAISVTSITPSHAGAYGYIRVRGTGFTRRNLSASYNLTAVTELVVISDTELTIILPDIGQPPGFYDLAIGVGGQVFHTSFPTP